MNAHRTRMGDRTNHRTTTAHRWSARRRGSTYFLVVSIGLLAGTISLGALALNASLRRQSQIVRDMSDADAWARSAVEYALNQLDNDPSWRSNFQAFQNGAASGPLAPQFDSQKQTLHMDGSGAYAAANSLWWHRCTAYSYAHINSDTCAYACTADSLILC